jgi:hypothetical protein
MRRFMKIWRLWAEQSGWEHEDQKQPEAGFIYGGYVHAFFECFWPVPDEYVATWLMRRG